MRTVFLFVDKPTFIGDLLKTQYIECLALKYRVVVFTKNLDQIAAAQAGCRQSPNIIYIKWQPRYDRFFGAMKFIRFSCISEFDHLATMKHYRNRRGQDGNNLLRILSRPFAKLLTSRFFFRLEKFLIRKPKEFAEYCRHYNPALLITATPGLNNFEVEAILLAKKFGIPSVSVDCAWDNLTTRATRVRPTDYFFAWHEPMRWEAVNIHGFKVERVFVPGPIRFDYYVCKDSNAPSREAFLESKGLNPKLKTVLYTTQKAHLFEESFLRRLIDLRIKKLIPYTNIFIRVHPLAAPGRFEEFRGLPDVCVEQPEKIMPDDELNNLKYTLIYSDLNVNYSSTMSLEAILFDKPVINYFEPSLKSFEINHYKPLVDAGAVKLINDSERELSAAVTDYLNNPSLDSEKRRYIADLYFPFRDGLSYKRNVDFLEKIIKDRE